MKILSKASVCLIVASGTLAGCTTADPTAYAGLASAHHLKADPSDRSGRVPYRYNSGANWRQYDKVIVDPVTVYRGQDHQFVKVSQQDKNALASYMHSRFTQELRTRFSVVSSPAPGTLRVHLTLTGAKTTMPVLGPFSHLDVGGGVYNAVQAARDKEGSMTGSVAYAVEIYDAMSNTLLSAYVTKQYPNAMNIGASFGALKASQVAIDKGADALLAQLRP
ncbi:DUF3313 domain-containing protein (plasmid) [Agrobacterium radiobacter]|uniref:DUF3313 domain-containing protein n=1 Tax=Agrobacterium tumefaciens complex TaxID=1183400 RepID=UPI0009BA9807|nr:DUF3313 domain-containing protein [Agrobacterium tumefaciens]MQB27858.1 DUF3313 domain-containing protein [Agrobacterium tumefaciens]NTA08368.1 DUF3313 domain-containing protein [Agrobacterium tumefaciens]NTB16190.1 DUF3313 domain-containing protein [Agrobacterium tumefaciens]SPZ33138.1 Protein of uncharacterised function (DUF3313) [Agrobacterium tumefaciens]